MGEVDGKMIALSDAEWKIMNALWDDSPKTITELTKVLADSTGWSKHTIITLLKRLEAKDAVYYEEGERAKQYFSNISQNEAIKEETRHFLDKTFKGKLGLMINTLIEEEDFSEQELDNLYALLEQKRNKKG